MAMKPHLDPKLFAARAKEMNRIWSLKDFIQEFTQLKRDEKKKLNYHGRCPLPKCLGTIIVNTKHNVYICEHCRHCGDITDFFMRLFKVKMVHALRLLEYRHDQDKKIRKGVYDGIR